MGDVNSSQTMNNKKDQEIKDILKDVETTATNFNKINNNNDNNNINLNDNNIKENNNKDPNILQSIDDIRKIFNNDYQGSYVNNNINLYGNNNIKDTRINNIFKNDLISSDSSFFNKSRSRVQNKPIIPKFNQDYEYNYNNNNIDNTSQNNQNDNYSYNSNNKQNNKYNINPNHMHKINAIINLLEDLNLENLLHVKNQIVKQIESRK